ncbi:MAG: methanogenesis marker protein Mmp4/MtxX [Methanothrix sp.]|nr:methanogenesis marker protein Mmp4/MtxX [Methanothrix sp.]
MRSLQEKARSRRARIGIGVWNADAELIASLQSATEYADLLLVGDPCCDCSLDYIVSKEPWKELVRLLADGEIDGAVRGNLPAGRTMRALAEQFDVRIRRLALLELSGWAFLLGPVGIDEGETQSDRLELLLGGAGFLQGMGVVPQAAVLSGGRMEDMGRCERVDRSLLEGELIAARAQEAGVAARHKGILIESCRGDDIVIAPEGVSGNLIFRTLLLLCGAKSFGAPVLMDRIFVDSSRARGGFDGPVMLASAMAGMREMDRDKNRCKRP